MEKTSPLRRLDFKTSFVLIVVAVLILIETSSFPMSGSVGGVDSIWYVSPALFPLIVVSILLICAIYLGYVAARNNGFQGFFSAQGWLGNIANKTICDRWVVILTLLAYVYMYVPSMDFYLASFVFLLTLNSRFYISSPPVFYTAVALNVILIVTLLCLRAMILSTFFLVSSEHFADETIVRCLDWIALAGCVGIIAYYAFVTYFVKNDIRPKALFNMLLCCVLIPYLVIAAFSFLLYVNVPVEAGIINKSMEWLIYEKLGL